jgi:hypothetical protein
MRRPLGDAVGQLLSIDGGNFCPKLEVLLPGVPCADFRTGFAVNALRE